MHTDFLDAHQRHWDDAERLAGSLRWANADHLYGLAAECGLKCLMKAFGMLTGGDGRPTERDDRVHVDDAWDRYETYRSGYMGTDYVLPTSNPFSDWNISQRYAHQSNFDEVRTISHRIGTDEVRKLVQKAQREGLL